MMSESEHRLDTVRQGDAAIRTSNVSDRQVSRTRAMLLASFDRLLLTRGYDNVSVRDLTAAANVGRSTFYEHFEGKDDLLEHSIAHPLAVLAATAATCAAPDALIDVLTHLLAQRALTRALLQGPARAIPIRVLARKLERHLAVIGSRSTAPPIAPLALLAASLAHAQLGAVDAWLSGDPHCDVPTAARMLHATTRASVAAMFTGG